MKQFLQDDAGNLSSTRLMFLAWSFVVLFVWAVISIKTWSMAAPPWEVVGILFTFGGVKVAQKYGEAK